MPFLQEKDEEEGMKKIVSVPIDVRKDRPEACGACEYITVRDDGLTVCHLLGENSEIILPYREDDVDEDDVPIMLRHVYCRTNEVK